MAVLNVTGCDGRKGTAFFNGNPISIGQVWYAEDIRGGKYCVTIADPTDEPSSPISLQQQYTDCYECLSANTAFLIFEVCNPFNNFIREITMPITEFGSLPNVGDVFYVTLLAPVRIGQKIQVTLCMEFNSYKIPSSQDQINQLNSVSSEIVIPPTLQTSCEDCFSANSQSYQVKRCNEEITDCVLLPPNLYTNHLISYSDGTDIWCGIVGDAICSSSTFYTFINDYGNTLEGIKCDVCQSTEQQKLLLQSCTDPNITQVVWASALYNGGEFSHLSTDEGCFEVVGSTESGVTINSYLNFDPQSGCAPCIECNGVAYDYYTCEDPPVFGTFYSYQELPFIGQTFYNPSIGKCCELVGTGSAYYANETLYSVQTFDDCPTCSVSVAPSIWKASACTNSNTYSSFYVTTDNTVTSGDIVKLMWGSNEWICAELTSSSYSGYYTYYNTQTDGVGNTVTYDSCASCNSQGLIGITLVPCELSNTEKFVSITLDNYLSIYNFGSLSNYTVKGEDGYCYRITNLCPIPLTADGFTPVEFYFNCNFCTDTPHRDANPESTVCVICCDCGATGSTITQVSPPHPVWTDGYGVPVTQLNMVTIGGNGLNS